MADCTPMYLLAFEADELIGRACLWWVQNEPLPKMLGLFRRPAQALLRQWPLLICKSPLSYSTGLIVSDQKQRSEILSAFAESALDIARDRRASFIVFDYLSKSDSVDWPPVFLTMAASEPGMRMENHWASLDEYLESAGKKDRQHYKRVLRESHKLGIRIEHHQQPVYIEEALSLIHNVESSHGALPNPWARSMLENMDMISSSFLTATIDGQLVGCGLLLEDNASQMTSILGLAKDIPYVYFMLVYESLKLAFDHNVHLLRWGSGAYDVKQRLGFSVEDNASIAFTAVHPVLQKMLHWMN